MLGLLAAVAIAGCGGSSTTTFTSTGAFSPYADVTLAPGEALSTPARQSGLGAVTAGFLDAGSGCTASWGGSGVDQAAVQRDVGALPKATRLTLSFGGRDGTELALACPTAAALRAQYAAAAARYRALRLDFDIEGRSLTDASSVARRWSAVAGLAGVSVTATLPVEPTGLTGAGLGVLRAAIAAHVAIARVNVLAMDFGDANAPHPAGRMARYVMAAATRAAAQLRALYPAPGTRPQLGVTVMIGRNDIADELFTPADARAVLAGAPGAGVVSLSMWSLGRDRPCPTGTPATAQPNCSGVAQQPYAFARILRAFRGASG